MALYYPLHQTVMSITLMNDNNKKLINLSNEVVYNFSNDIYFLFKLASNKATWRYQQAAILNYKDLPLRSGVYKNERPYGTLTSNFISAMWFGFLKAKIRFGSIRQALVLAMPYVHKHIQQRVI